MMIEKTRPTREETKVLLDSVIDHQLLTPEQLKKIKDKFQDLHPPKSKEYFNNSILTERG